jgi:hypothetical protein
VQVRGEGGIRVGANIVGAIFIVVLGDRDPLGNDELLFQVTGDGLLLPSEGGGALTRPCLIQSLVCGSYDGDESLLLTMRGSGDGLSRGRNVIICPLGGGGDCGGGLLLIDGEVEGTAQHGR